MMFINEITLSEEKQIEIMAGIISVACVQFLKLRFLKEYKDQMNIQHHSLLLALVWGLHVSLRKILVKIYNKMRENKMLQN